MMLCPNICAQTKMGLSETMRENKTKQPFLPGFGFFIVVGIIDLGWGSFDQEFCYKSNNKETNIVAKAGLNLTIFLL